MATYQALFGFTLSERHALEALSRDIPAFGFDDPDRSLSTFAGELFRQLWENLGNALVDGPLLVRETMGRLEPPLCLAEGATLARFQVKWDRAFGQALFPVRRRVRENLLDEWARSLTGSIIGEAIRIVGSASWSDPANSLSFFRAERFAEIVEIWQEGRFREGYRFSAPDGRWMALDGMTHDSGRLVRRQVAGVEIRTVVAPHMEDVAARFWETWVHSRETPTPRFRGYTPEILFYRQLLEHQNRHELFQWLVDALAQMLGLTRAALFQPIPEVEAFRGVYAYHLPQERVRRVIEDRSRFLELIEEGRGAPQVIEGTKVIAERYVKEFELQSLVVVPIGSAPELDALFLGDKFPHPLGIGQEVLTRAGRLAEAVAVHAGNLAQRSHPTPSSVMSRLTAREREVVRYLCDGWSNRMIAESLNVSPYTVREHVSHILQKLGADSRAEVVSLLFRPR